MKKSKPIGPFNQNIKEWGGIQTIRLGWPITVDFFPRVGCMGILDMDGGTTVALLKIIVP